MVYRTICQLLINVPAGTSNGKLLKVLHLLFIVIDTHTTAPLVQLAILRLDRNMFQLCIYVLHFENVPYL